LVFAEIEALEEVLGVHRDLISHLDAVP